MTQITINNVILQYPQLFEPKGFRDSKEVYSSKLIISKENTEGINAIKTEIKRLCEENKILHKPDSFQCFKDGEMSGIDQYKDYYILLAKANVGRAPKVIDWNRESVDSKTVVINGTIANVMVGFWNYAYGGMSKGIACNLLAVQLTNKRDEKFMSEDKVNVNNSFSVLEQESEEIPF